VTCAVRVATAVSRISALPVRATCDSLRRRIIELGECWSGTAAELPPLLSRISFSDFARGPHRGGCSPRLIEPVVRAMASAVVWASRGPLGFARPLIQPRPAPSTSGCSAIGMPRSACRSRPGRQNGRGADEGLPAAISRPSPSATSTLGVDRLDRAQALAMFELAFLDLDATRDQFAADLTAHLSEVETQESRSAREVSEKAAQIARVERDYLAGDLTAPTYERLSAQLQQEHAAAAAEHERLSANAIAVRASRAELDAEGAVLHRLAGLQVSVLERVRTAEQQEDVDALRASLAQAFSAVYIGPDGAVSAAEPRVQPDIDPLAVPLPYWEPDRVAVPFTRYTTLAGTGVPE
jgi:hypothetical protein